MRHQGRITSWKDDKGFGFISPNSGGKPVFLHINAFSQRQHRPVGDEWVTYELAANDNGRPQAKAVAFVGERPAPPNPPGRNNLAPVFTGGFLLLVVAAVIGGWLPIFVPLLYLVASLVTFFAYGFDKSAASRNEWRTPERTLHLFGLLGGWPGAVAAQRLLRHKSAKKSFQASFRVTVALNCGALGGYLSPFVVNVLRSASGAG